MKRLLITVIFLFISATAFGKSDLSKFMVPDEAFNRYRSDLPWKQQMALLGDFAVFLQRNPETIGYILIHTGERDSPKKVKFRVNRTMKFLTQYMKVEKKRIVIIYVGKFGNSEMILQPVDKNLPPPKF